MKIQYESVTANNLVEFKDFMDEHNMLSDTDYDRLRIFIEKNPFLSKLALADGKVVGGVLCSYDGLRGHLLKLVVHEDYRKQGIGKELISKVIDELKAMGCPEVSINCRPYLQKWYEGQGFKKLDYIFYIKYLGQDPNSSTC